MEVMAISKFKATCLAVLEKVRETGQPIIVTKRGIPVAQVVPPDLPAAEARFGCLADKTQILGDLVEPVGEELWSVLK